MKPSFQFHHLRVSSPGHGVINCIPEHVPAEPDHRIYRATGSFGSFTFHELLCRDFAICYGSQEMLEDMNLSIQASLSFLGMVFFLGDTVESTFEALPSGISASGHYSLLNLPDIKTNSLLRRDHKYMFMAVALNHQRHILQFKTVDPVLSEFISYIREGKPCYAEPAVRSTPYEMEMILEKVVNHHGKPHLRSHYLNALMHQLLNHSLEATGAVDPKESFTEAENKGIDAVHEQVLRNFQDTGSLADLAKLAGMNESKLNAGFKLRYGLPVFAYQRVKRMEKARQLLKEGQLSIQDIATDLGYTSVGHFTEAFKKVHGVPPSKYVGP